MRTRTRHSSSLVPIGYIRKAHGIKGEVALNVEAESTDFLRGSVLWLHPGDAPQTKLETLRKLVVEAFRRHHGALLVKFAGIEDRTQAEILRRHTVFVPRELIAANEEDVYLHDLPGLRVFVREKDGGRREIGLLESVDEPAGQELWTIVTPEGQEILFPAAPQFVVNMDIAEGTLCIDPPPGLLELYLDG
jgi:16S rRNA processing protein RimM